MFLLHRGCGHLFPSLFCGDSSFSLRQFLVVSGGFEWFWVELMMIWYDSGEKRRTIRVWSFRIEGVALWWKKDLQVLLLSFSPNHTDISVLVSGGSQAL